MTKQEFMYRLAQQLVSLPPEERVCALKFYDEYFADAGEENADAVIRDLGSPEEVARTIKEDFAQRNPGYQPDSQYQYRPGPQYQPGQGRQTYTTNPSSYYQPPSGPPPSGGGSGCGTALVVVLILLTSPIWLALLVALMGVVIGIGAAVIGVVVAAVAVVAALLGTGILTVWAAVTAPLITIGQRILALGGGLLAAGVGLLALAALLWIACHVIPVVFRWLVELCRKPFHKKGGNNQ